MKLLAFVGALIVGGLVGTGVALLFGSDTPETGWSFGVILGGGWFVYVYLEARIVSLEKQLRNAVVWVSAPEPDEKSSP